jgi:phosphoglycerate dehydrogenase-like enzyme
MKISAVPLNDTKSHERFRVTWTGDFFDGAGTPRYPDLGLNVLDAAPHIEATRFAEHRADIGPDQIAGAQGVIVLTPRVTRASLRGSDSLLAIGRFGVGFETVDVAACTEADVVVFITPGAVDRPVAEATICWMLALSHNLLAKDRLVRTGAWEARSRYLGCELRERTLGIVGLGRIGRAVVELLRHFGMNPPLAFDTEGDPEAARALGLTLVPLDELLARADFVSLHCPLTEKTNNLIGTRELALMKPAAYLINTARGGIVNEDALYEALAERRLAGAALDCFVGEPIVQPHRFGTLDNVLLAPHSIAHTHELFRDIGRAVCQGMVDLSLGRRPAGVLNPEVFERPGFQVKWRKQGSGSRGQDL